MYLLCPAKDHVVVDLDIKLVTSSAKMVEHCLSIIYLDTDSAFHNNYCYIILYENYCCLHVIGEILINFVFFRYTFSFLAMQSLH